MGFSLSGYILRIDHKQNFAGRHILLIKIQRFLHRGEWEAFAHDGLQVCAYKALSLLGHLQDFEDTLLRRPGRQIKALHPPVVTPQ